jgi:hypothetical protein
MLPLFTSRSDMKCAADAYIKRIENIAQQNNKLAGETTCREETRAQQQGWWKGYGDSEMVTTLPDVNSFTARRGRSREAPAPARPPSLSA